MRKYLFLDIDGVLNNKNTNFKTDLWPLDRYCAFLVGKIQMETNCYVVLSSSWRHHPEAVALLNKTVVPILDITGRCCNGIRGVEIHKWLQQQVYGFNSASYRKADDIRIAILDDDSDMLLWQGRSFFQTSFETGLTEEIANAVINHLNSESQ